MSTAPAPKTKQARRELLLSAPVRNLVAKSNHDDLHDLSASVGIARPPKHGSGSDVNTPGDIHVNAASPPPTTTCPSRKTEEIDLALEAVKDALVGFGVLSGPRDPDQVWQRPIPSNLFQPPRYLPSLTTIMPTSQLPPGAKIRGGRNGTSKNVVDDDELVEVWTHSLTSDFDGEAGNGNDLHQRPLQGNLSSKLVEYTRGAMGVRKPFRPGGMDDEDTSFACRDEEFLSEEATANARLALTLGSKEALERGILIMAPPGVSFSEGLSYDDIFDDGDRLSARTKKDEHVAADEMTVTADAEVEKDTTSTDQIRSNFAAPTSALWDKSFFEDDSLFGDSTSGSDSESDGSDDEDTVQEEEHDNKKGIPGQDELANETTAASPLTESQSPSDEVDSLLTELHASLESPETLSKSHSTIHPPLSSNTDKDLASKSDPKARKSWAVTEYIPITPTSDFATLLPNPALSFPFELDDFQKQAVLRLERSECVFLAAHTSAGKTVCAEYAIALAKKHCTRAIYTSPIKALSNQKYRDFRTKFGEDVGLITGDMQIGADGSCLIMTTEILRSMLYRGADLIRDIEWVIFDEVHYINDSERGVVWEEVIIMLPDYVNLIFLSATTPNTIEFSEWIGRTKRKPVHVIRTNYRPVPLSHHLWAGHKMHTIMEGKEGFSPKGYADASKALLPASAREAAENKKKGDKGKKPPPASARPSSGSKMSSWQQQGSKQDWISLTRYLEREGLMPTVTFSFSKKKCEEIADMLRSLDLNTAAERNLVQSFAIQTVARLSPKDQSLPQVTKTVEMVKRGIGVHHGGLLPILKEMVEILFSRNLIKILFATETFAMGVNMPARSVVFNAIRKHDGVQFRELQPGEYTQMAGRAGRRGLDKVGTVILCCFGDQPPPQTILRNMLTGQSTKLQSQFRLTYTMILNLLRVEDMSVEGMIKRSFSEFATQRALTTNEYPKLLARGTKTLLKLDEEFKQDADNRMECEDIEEYYSASQSVLSLNKQLLSYLLGSGGTGGGALVAGRVLLVTSARQHFVHAPALVLRPPEPSTKSSNSGGPADVVFVCMVLLPQSFTRSEDDAHEKDSKLGNLDYVGESQGRFFRIQNIRLEDIWLVSTTKHKIDSSAFYKGDASKSTRVTQSFGNPFAGAKQMKDRNNDTRSDNPFAGMKARGKTGDVSAIKTPGVSRATQLVEEAMSYLVNAESIELDSGLSMLDFRECAKNMHQGNSAMDFGSACDRLKHAVAFAREFRSHYHPNIDRHYVTVDRRETLRSRVETLRHLLSNESLQLFPDFLQRKALLQSLGYVDENDTVVLKGRVACEVNTCEGLIVTEMVFEGMLNELEPAEIVAALSALLFQEKTDEDFDSELPERLVSSCERMRGIAIELGQRQKDFGLPVDPLEYCATSLKMGLVHVVYEWACGVPFISICELTDVQEGSIVRCITRLDELCREVRNCARVVGNPTLYRKMEAASEAIKRDIVFASSLYVS
ncbi:hypothetical protein ACHAWF_011790 [Thalassiosira exigua]